MLIVVMVTKVVGMVVVLEWGWSGCGSSGSGGSGVSGGSSRDFGR